MDDTNIGGKAFTLRADAEGVALLDSIRRMTGHAAYSRAIWQALRDYGDMRDRAAQAEAKAERLEAALVDLAQSCRRADLAQARQVQALDAAVALAEELAGDDG